MVFNEELRTLNYVLYSLYLQIVRIQRKIGNKGKFLNLTSWLLFPCVAEYVHNNIAISGNILLIDMIVVFIFRTQSNVYK